MSYIRNDFDDVLIYCGLDADLQSLISKTRLKNYHANTDWDKVIRQSYELYKTNLTITPDRVVQIVDKSKWFENSQTNPVHKRAVYVKIKQIAANHFQEEKDYSFVYRLFHKLGQFLQGRGFRTRGEWTSSVATRVEKSYHIDHPFQKLIDLQRKLKFEDIDFNLINVETGTSGHIKDFVKNVLFAKEFEDGEKLKIWKNFNFWARLCFIVELKNTDDWFLKAYDIIKGASLEDIDNFVHGAPFRSQYDEYLSPDHGCPRLSKPEGKKGIRDYQNSNKDASLDLLFTILIEREFQYAYKNKGGYCSSLDSYPAAVVWQSISPEKRNEILESPKILTAQELTYLKEIVAEYQAHFDRLA